MLYSHLFPGLIVLIDNLPAGVVQTVMIEPEVTGSGVEDGAEDAAEDDHGVIMGAVKVSIDWNWDLKRGK